MYVLICVTISGVLTDLKKIEYFFLNYMYIMPVYIKPKSNKQAKTAISKILKMLTTEKKELKNTKCK